MRGHESTRGGAPRPWGLVLAIFLALDPWSASAGTAPQAELAAARARFSDLDFEGALAAFTALAERDGVPPKVIAAALVGKGLCLQVLRRGKEARAAFLDALAIDPEQTLPPDTSPKLRRPFSAARKAFRSSYAPTLHLERSALASGSIVVRAKDPLGLVAKVVVLVSGQGRVETLEARDRGDGSFEAHPQRRGRLLLRVQARNQYGLIVARLGHPKALVIRLPGSNPPAPTLASGSGETASTRRRETKVASSDDGSSAEPARDEGARASAAATTPSKVRDETGSKTNRTSMPETRPAAPEGDGGTLALHPPDPSPGGAVSSPEGPSPGPRAGLPSSRKLALGLGGGAVASLASAVVLGLKAQADARAFQGDPSAFTSQAEALALGRRAKNEALAANLLYGGAALLAGGATALWFATHPRAVDPGEDEATFALAIGGEGATVVVSFSLR